MASRTITLTIPAAYSQKPLKENATQKESAKWKKAKRSKKERKLEAIKQAFKLLAEEFKDDIRDHHEKIIDIFDGIVNEIRNGEAEEIVEDKVDIFDSFSPPF